MSTGLPADCRIYFVHNYMYVYIYIIYIYMLYGLGTHMRGKIISMSCQLLPVIYTRTLKDYTLYIYVCIMYIYMPYGLYR